MKIGKVRDAHGMKGELFVISFTKDLVWLEAIEELELKGAMANEKGKHEETVLRFPIQSYKPHKKGAIVRVEGVSNRTDAEKLIGFTIEVDPQVLTSEAGEKIFLREVEGFVVLNQGQERGVIVGFSSNGAQDLATIKRDGAEFSVPFIPEMIEQIDWPSKKVLMKYPPELENLTEH